MADACKCVVGGCSARLESKDHPTPEGWSAAKRGWHFLSAREIVCPAHSFEVAKVLAAANRHRIQRHPDETYEAFKARAEPPDANDAALTVDQAAAMQALAGNFWQHPDETYEDFRARVAKRFVGTVDDSRWFCKRGDGRLWSCTVPIGQHPQHQCRQCVIHPDGGTLSTSEP